MMRPWAWFARWALLAVALLALVFSWWIVLGLASDLPGRLRLVSVTVQPDAISPIILGSDTLLQPSEGPLKLRPTAKNHVAISVEGNQIVMRDVTAIRRVGYYGADNKYRSTSAVDIPQGTSQIMLENAVFDVQVDGARLWLHHVDGTKILNLHPRTSCFYFQGNCRDTTIIETGWIDRMGALMRGYSMGFVLGGKVDNKTQAGERFARRQVPLPGFPERSATLRFKSEAGWSFRNTLNGRWQIEAGRLPAAVVHLGVSQDAEARAIPIVENERLLVNRVVIGFTHYHVIYDKVRGALQLEPFHRPAWVNPSRLDDAPTDPRIRWNQIQATTALREKDLNIAMLACLCSVGLIFCMTRGAAMRVTAAVGIATAGTAFAAGALFLGLNTTMTAIFAFSSGLTMAGSFRVLSGMPRSNAGKLYGVFLVGFGGLGALAVLWFRAQFQAEDPQQTMALVLAGAWVAMAGPVFTIRIPMTAALFWGLVICVAAFGAASGIQMALAHTTEAWTELSLRHLFMLAGCAMVVSFVLAWAVEQQLRGLQRRLLPKGDKSANIGFFLKWAFYIFVSIAFLGITLAGNETGFAGLFQPSEMTKSILVLLVAVTLTIDIGRRSMLSAVDGSFSLIRPVLAIILAGCLAATSLLNYDMSPILVSGLAVFVTLMAGAALHFTQTFRRSSRRRMAGLQVPRASKANRAHHPHVPRFRFRVHAVRNVALWPVGLTFVFISMLSATVLLAIQNPNFEENAKYAVADELRTPWKRWQSYLDMRLTGADPQIDFPETGDQLRQGREALVLARCKYVAYLCPTQNLAQNTAQVDQALIGVPAIQDDFAAVSLVHGLGIDGATLYFIAQIMLMVAGLAIGVTALFGSRYLRLVGWMGGCGAIGLSILYGAQVLFAWGNVLGFLPVMGQPMTFVSFGASHHSGVALPFLTLVILCTVLNEPEVEDVHSVRRDLLVKQLG